MDILSISKEVKKQIKGFKQKLGQMIENGKYEREKTVEQMGTLLEIRRDYRSIWHLIQENKEMTKQESEVVEQKEYELEVL